MEKDRKVSLRLSGVRVDFAKSKLGVKRDGDLLRVLLDMYWLSYNPLENPFKDLGVPKNGISKEKKDEKIKVQSEQGKPKGKDVILVSGDKEDGGELEAGIVTVIKKGQSVKGKYENGLFKRV